jgi:hypothetical protein
MGNKKWQDETIKEANQKVTKSNTCGARPGAPQKPTKKQNAQRQDE